MDRRHIIRRRRQVSIAALWLLGAWHGAVADTWHLPLLPAAGNPAREGVVRIVNHSATSGDISITAIDDLGGYFGPVTLSLDARAAIQFSAADLERGSTARGFASGVGDGEGDWRLLFESDLDIEPLVYVETPAGFIDSLHDVVAPRAFHHRVALAAPDKSRGDAGGTLRLVNPAPVSTDVLVLGLNDNGALASGHVELSIPAGASRSLSAAELENGTSDVVGSLADGDGDGDRDGDRDGNWRLLIFADTDIAVMTLMDSPSGPLANLSAADFGAGPRQGSEVMLFPSAAEPSRTGELRITSQWGSGEVLVRALDEAGKEFGPVTLTLEEKQTVSLDSRELQAGNAAKGLPIGLGDGEGDWRLFIESDVEVDIFAYVRSPEAVLTTIGSLAAASDRRHHVPLFFRGSEARRESLLRLINPDDSPAEVRIQAWDDAGEAAPNGTISLTLAGGTTRTLGALEMEAGADDLAGSLGRGDGDWRLMVEANADIRVMSLVESAEGHTTNLSTSSIVPHFLADCVGGAVDSDADGISDHCDIDTGNALRPLSACGDGTFVTAPGLNSGLVGDCHVLVGFANYQAQSGDVPDDHPVRRWGFGGQGRTGNWEGIDTSSSRGRVTAIRLRGVEGQPGGLTGHIPPSLGSLTALTGLDLAFHQLSGPIPPELGALADLTYLFLGFNRLTGSIPVELGRLTRLQQLWLEANRLSGPIPRQLGELAALTGLNIRSNRLTGSIPESLGELSHLEAFLVDDNRLTGTIPSELGKLSQLTRLFLRRNQLTGSIPESLGELSRLEDLLVDDNRLTGAIPSELGKLSQLNRLWLHRNQLTGTIPESLEGLSQLEDLLVENNRLTGAIPAELGELNQLTRLWLSRNQLTGTIPESLGELSRLEELRVDNNRLTGAIPAELGKLSQLTGLRLHWNQLTGSIPESLGELSRLEDLTLGNNRLTGSIPSELGNLSQLTRLRLNRNRLTGSIPESLGELSRLEELSLDNNQLTGTIPWPLWDRSERGELRFHYLRNAIQGVSPPPARSRPVFSGSSTENGNAAHHSVSYYQGPLTWEWNWEDEPVEHQQPLLGRWAALAVRIDHELRTPPLVATRVLDSDGAVLAERLSEAASPATEAIGQGRWRTRFVFDLPGALYRAGNQIVHMIDPDNDLAETNEDDNVGAPIRLYGREPPPFRVTFIPLYPTGEEPPSFDPNALMSGTLAFLPLGDDYRAAIGRPRASDAVDTAELIDEMLALWNAEADADEFYHGIFTKPWLNAPWGGRAVSPGRVAVSGIEANWFSSQDVIPHEFGHNLGLQHTPGCDAGGVDENYPYSNGRLGSEPGWDVNWRRFVFGDGAEPVHDVMSYCAKDWRHISDYHYRKASDYWLGTATGAASRTARTVVRGIAQRGLGSGGSNLSSPVAGPPAPDAAGEGGLALSGRIDAAGRWSLTHVQLAEKGPRPPQDGDFTLILLDNDGAELHRESLAPSALSEGDVGAWAVRTPIPAPAPGELVIRDAQGEIVLRDELPALE